MKEDNLTNGLFRTRKSVSKFLEGLKIGKMDIEISTEFPPGNKIPCITMNDNGGQGLVEIETRKIMKPLPADHPYYKPVESDELYQQGIEYTYTY